MGDAGRADDFTATSGRLRFVEEAGLDRPEPSWWQAERGERELIPRGLDFLTTIDADQWVDVPEEMLGEGMEAFRQNVHFRGARLGRDIGDADTVMERMADGALGQPIPTRLVAFGNVSAAPIELRGEGAMAGLYQLIVTLSPTQESPGEMTLFSEDGITGTFASKVSLAPLFELRPLEGGHSIFVDTGRVKLPGFPMEMASSGGHWSRRPVDDTAVAGAEGHSLFYPGAVSIITQKLNPRGAGHAPFVVAACRKSQATLRAVERTVG